MAAIIGVGNVTDRASATRLDTKKLAAELKALRCAAGLAFARSARGGFDVWVEMNDNADAASRAGAVAAATMQAQRLGIALR